VPRPWNSPGPSFSDLRSPSTALRALVRLWMRSRSATRSSGRLRDRRSSVRGAARSSVVSRSLGARESYEGTRISERVTDRT
jgi:hypothetical protein